MCTVCTSYCFREAVYVVCRIYICLCMYSTYYDQMLWSGISMCKGMHII